MKKNLHFIDRIVRVAFAAVLAVLILNGTLTGFVAVLLGIFAIIFLATGILSFCPIYKMVGFSTLKDKPGTV